MQVNIGDKIGRWLVLSGPHRETRVTAHSTNYIETFLCQCDCGTRRYVRKFKLLKNSRSCGCLKIERFIASATSHGHNRRGRRTRLYRVWDGMIQRCRNANHDSYHRYGGRGIDVCDEWTDFAIFAKWAKASGYRDDAEIDRINNDGGYSPNNCRWVSPAQNKRNTSQNSMLSAFGEIKCLTDWALDARCTVTPSTIRFRIARGASPEMAVSGERATKRSAPRFEGNHVKSRL